MNLQELMNSTWQANNNANEIGWGFDVLNTINKENEDLMQSFRNVMYDRFKQRSDMRKNIKLWKVTTWNKENDNKTVKTSELADTFTDAMVFLGKDPQYMLDTYWSSEGNINLINKVKWLQWGKYSGDIQNYIDGKSNDLTWLVNNIFPTYVSWWNFEQDRTKSAEEKTANTQDTRSQQTLEWYTPSAWDKMVNFRWSDIWLAHEWRPVKSVANVVGWAVDTAQKVPAWISDIANKAFMMSPEEFNEKIDKWWYSWDYDYDKEHWIFNWTYEQWKDYIKDDYAQRYTKATTNVQQIDDNRWEFWFNTMDPDSTSFKIWELWAEIWEQVLLDRWFAKVLWEWYKIYKWSKNVKKATKWTELATKSSELAAPWTELSNPALATIKNADGTVNPEVVKESKDIATKVMAWLSKSPTVKWAKDAMEFQLIWDVQDGKLSDAQAYWINAWLWAFLGKMLWLWRSTWKYIADPKEKLQTSLSRLWVEDTDEIINLAEIWAKDWTKPSALQATTESVIKEAKKNATKIRDRVWEEELWPIRKSLPNDVNADIEKDIIEPLNESITNKWIGGKIVYKDGVASVEWNAGEYTEALKAIADKINSIKSNLEQKLELRAQWKKVDIPSSTRIYEEIYSDLKRVSMNEKDNAVKKNILDIQNDMLDVVKKQLTPEQYEAYKKALENYSKAATRVSKIDQAESMMMNRNVVDQWKFKDWQYLSDFLIELEKDWIISKNAADRRIAAIFADAFYGWPVKDTDKLIYPSLPWFMEKILQTTWDIAKNPKWTKLFWQEIWWGWRKFNTNYKPAAWTKIVSWIWNRGSAAGIWKATTSAADNWED